MFVGMLQNRMVTLQRSGMLHSTENDTCFIYLLPEIARLGFATWKTIPNPHSIVMVCQEAAYSNTEPTEIIYMDETLRSFLFKRKQQYHVTTMLPFLWGFHILPIHMSTHRSACDSIFVSEVCIYGLLPVSHLAYSSYRFFFFCP